MGGIKEHILQAFLVSLLIEDKWCCSRELFCRFWRRKKRCISFLTNGEGEVSVFPWFVKTSILKREGGKAVFFIKMTDMETYF